LFNPVKKNWGKSTQSDGTKVGQNFPNPDSNPNVTEIGKADPNHNPSPDPNR